jgi:AI2M/AI1M-like HNH endonuclease
MCGRTENLQVHHIRKLADLDLPGRPETSAWVILMAKRRRKTLVVCGTCHATIHSGRPTATPTE